MRRRLHLALLLLVGASSVLAQKEHPRGFGPRFLDVGFEVNPFSKASQMRGGAEEEAQRQHR
jgi:hypothetical protein